MTKILNTMTFKNFFKYVALQFGCCHIFYSALNGGEGQINDIHSWIPAFVFVGMICVVSVCEFIRRR